MEELIKNCLLFYIFATAFMGIWTFQVVYGTFKKTKNIEGKKIKIALRLAISIVLVCLLVWDFVYNLYPVSLAYYEYKNNLAEEKIGVIDSIEQESRDRMHFIIDNTEYTMVYSSTDPFVIIGWDIDEGDTVKFKFGEKSKYIFDIYRSGR